MSALSQLMVSSGDTLYHSPEFLAYVHSHKTLLKQGAVKAPLDPGIVHKFEYNFVSLLIELNYPLEDLSFYLIVNDLECPTQMRKDMKELAVPDQGVMTQLKALYRQQPGRI